MCNSACAIQLRIKRVNTSLCYESSCSSAKGCPVLIEEAALTTLAELCDGDARIALNGLQLAVQAKQALLTRNQSPSTKYSEEHTSSVNSNPTSSAESTPSNELNSNENSSKNKGTVSDSNTPPSIVTVQDVKESLQRSHLIYDRAGDEHYNIISALHKSMRGGDTNASLYWLARMLCGGEDPLYVARRVVRFASEDIGDGIFIRSHSVIVHYLYNKHINFCSSN